MSRNWGILAKEASRKSVHMAGFLIPVAYYFFLSRELLLVVLCAGVLCAGALEYVRLSGNRLYPAVLLRDHEKNGVLAGYFFALLSSFLAVLLFDKPIAIAAMLFLTLGDGITGLAGAAMTMLVGPGEAHRRGRSPTGSSIVGEFMYALTHPKSPVLMAVMFIVCAAIGLCLYPALSSRMIVAGALGAVIADAFPWRVAGFTVDDNLSIPLLSGALMWLAGFPQA